ncbi:hypothetical protein [Marinobacter sp. KMM 10035]|uniref:hypothetical protein n=1 Tax=Marinobacter sp. KMM 10035 TaxID=3134034 RepID=UPI00397CCCDB
MRAELFPRPVTALQVSIALSLTLIAAGCKTEKDPDQPTILGIPPGVAYIGVEYYYNFGAYGGEDILDYSLTNAPSWLALEDTSNKARQGIIMRGVPGLNGGARGDADLGKLTNINLVSTDGQMAGAVPFDIEVKYNVLSLEAETFTEGKSPSIPDTNRERCELPDLETPGEHSFTVNTYDANGAVTASPLDLTLPTRPVFVKVLLDRPSVTRVAVAFELISDYNPQSCDPGFTAPHQRCDHGRANTGDAIPGTDIVALGSGSEALLEDIPYLTYETDPAGAYPGVYTGGVITFEPGITECYIRLEVVDDSFPEPTEVAQLRLTEVRSGLAAVGPTNEGARTNLVIDDNEPEVHLETVKGGTRDALNVGDSRTYIARLTGERDGEIRAKLGHTEDSSARLNTEFGTDLPNDELVFPVGTDEVSFTVTVEDPASYFNAGPDDRFMLLGLDTLYQLGRENYARVDDEDVLRVSINELTSPLTVGSRVGFVATDVVVGHGGKMFVAGYDSADSDRVFVKIYDQKGNLLQSLSVSAPGDQLAAPDPVVGVARREVVQNNIRTIRYELVVAYTAEGPTSGTTGVGGKDVVSSLYWYDEASNTGEYVETWTTRTGTTADDIVRSAGINPASGFVVIAGETEGEWPDQTSAGGFDSFVQRIDSLPDGNTFAPTLAWTRQAGSAADDRVAGARATGLSPILFGSAMGSVNGESSLGGEDVYFYSAASKDGELNVRQRGTDADEQVADGIVEGTTLWLLGNGSNRYTVEQGDEDSLSLTSQPDSSLSGFILGYTIEGEIVRSFNLNDENDLSSEQFSTLTGFFGDLIAGGVSDGDFTGSAGTSGSETGIVARISLVPEDEPDAETAAYRNEWRFQINAADSNVMKLANYRDDEVVALTRIGADWAILLLSPEGTLLTP